MINFQEGKIYSISSIHTDKIYIGSTTLKLEQRFKKHKEQYKLWLEGKFTYLSSFEIIKYDDASINLIELYPCQDSSELHKKEGNYIKNNNCVNKIIAGRDRHEFYVDNKDKIDTRSMLRYQNNKDSIHIKWKTYHDCECGLQYQHNSKSKHFRTMIHNNRLHIKENLFYLEELPQLVF